MSEGSFEYKCRRCGVTEGGVLESGCPRDTLVCAAIGFKRGPDRDINLLRVHGCEDGGAGIADLIGFRKIAP